VSAPKPANVMLERMHNEMLALVKRTVRAGVPEGDVWGLVFGVGVGVALRSGQTPESLSKLIAQIAEMAARAQAQEPPTHPVTQ
jgi:hypothetical protein